MILLVACLCMVGWLVRSFSILDFANCRSVGGSSYPVESKNGAIAFVRRTPTVRGPRFDYCRISIEKGDHLELWQHLNVKWRADFFGFHFGAAQNTTGTIRTIELWIIPYWSIAVPLTLLTAYLLFTNPRLSPSASQSGVHE